MRCYIYHLHTTNILLLRATHHYHIMYIQKYIYWFSIHMRTQWRSVQLYPNVIKNHHMAVTSSSVTELNECCSVVFLSWLTDV